MRQEKESLDQQRPTIWRKLMRKINKVFSTISASTVAMIAGGALADTTDLGPKPAQAVVGPQAVPVSRPPIIIDFELDAPGTKPNGFASVGKPANITFRDTIGGDLQVGDYGGQSHGKALAVFPDDASPIHSSGCFSVRLWLA
jgi:hypothetical protein